jgi:hypothetical protein
MQLVRPSGNAFGNPSNSRGFMDETVLDSRLGGPGRLIRRVRAGYGSKAGILRSHMTSVVRSTSSPSRSSQSLSGTEIPFVFSDLQSPSRLLLIADCLSPREAGPPCRKSCKSRLKTLSLDRINHQLHRSRHDPFPDQGDQM